MFDDMIINRPETKLLYNIQELLIEQNELLKKILPSEKVSEEINDKIPCKYCGGEHDNKGQVMACAKKHKKGV